MKAPLHTGMRENNWQVRGRKTVTDEKVGSSMRVIEKRMRRIALREGIKCFDLVRFSGRRAYVSISGHKSLLR